MHGTNLVIYTFLVLALGGVIGIGLDHLLKSAMSHKNVNVALVVGAFFACLAVVVIPSTLFHDMRNAFSANASPARHIGHSEASVVPGIYPTPRPAPASTHTKRKRRLL